MKTPPDSTISTILKHDAKITSYKIALLRAINDVVLAFPDVRTNGWDVAIPLRQLAEYWIAYYWPFVSLEHPILQGQRAVLDGELRNDMAFRPLLTRLREMWADMVGGSVRPADGFFLVNELRIARRRAAFPPEFLAAYGAALKAISDTLQMPIRYAGPGEWSVFERPKRFADLRKRTVPIPGTRPDDKCLVVKADLWHSFQTLSLWVEALSIHEWCLFTESKADQQDQDSIDRGDVYRLLTDRPDNRRPLTWERNQIDLLIMEGEEFRCPWTEKWIRSGVKYDLDHLVPLSVYPSNELWNLVPSDPWFNSHRKRDRLPTTERLIRARPHLTLAYSHYDSTEVLGRALREDVAVRFSGISTSEVDYPDRVVTAVAGLIERVAESRNLARF